MHHVNGIEPRPFVVKKLVSHFVVHAALENFSRYADTSLDS